MDPQPKPASFGDLLLSALSTLISLKGQNFSQGEVEVRSWFEEESIVEAEVLLDDGFNPPVFHEPTILSLIIKDGTIETISQNGQEIFVEILEDVPAFTQAAALVVTAVIEALDDNLDYLLSRAAEAREIVVEEGAEDVLETFNDISGAIDSSMGSLNQSVSRRGAVKHFSRLAVKASTLGRV